MAYCEINGARLNYDDVGEGEVLLFGHTFLWDRRMWDLQVKELSRNYRCIVPDLWGHGESECRPGPFSVEGWAQDHFALMDQLGIEKFSIIGLSMGGMWGAHMAVEQPKRINQLVLIATDLGEDPEETQEKFFEMLDAISAADRIPEEIIEAIVPLFFSSKAVEAKSELRTRLAQDFREKTSKQAKVISKVGRAIFLRKSLLNKVSELMVPTLVIVGEDDVLRPIDRSERIVAAIPGARLSVIPGAGHVPAKEQPELLNVLLEDFLSQ